MKTLFCGGAENMAVWVEGATDKILKAAKEEFMEQGFLMASLRTIAEKADTSPRSIYTRFANKEELFAYFVKDHMEYFRDEFQRYLTRFESQSVEEQVEGRETGSSHCLYELTDYIYAHFDAFYLLVCCSEGTLFEKFIEELATMEATYTDRYMQHTAGDGKKPEIDYDFIHIMSRSFFEGYFEIVRHRYDVTRAKTYIGQLLKFSEAGWSQFLQ